VNKILCSPLCVRAQIEASKEKSQFTKEVYENISRQFDWKNFTDKNLTRQFRLLTDQLGVAVLPINEVLQVSGPVG